MNKVSILIWLNRYEKNQIFLEIQLSQALTFYNINTYQNKVTLLINQMFTIESNVYY